MHRSTQSFRITLAITVAATTSCVVSHLSWRWTVTSARIRSAGLNYVSIAWVSRMPCFAAPAIRAAMFAVSAIIRCYISRFRLRTSRCTTLNRVLPGRWHRSLCRRNSGKQCLHYNIVAESTRILQMSFGDVIQPFLEKCTSRYGSYYCTKPDQWPASSNKHSCRYMCSIP